MRYLVIGAGGTGGPLSAYLARAKKEVTVIARGRHLEAVRQKGLKIETVWGEAFSAHVNACSMEEYKGKPDVVFVCVKGYSLEETISFLKTIAHPQMIVIPILNLYGTGETIQRQIPQILVTDGCIYVSANIKEPGVIQMHGKIFRVVYGVRNPEEYDARLEQVKRDLDESGIAGVLSDNIKRDAMEKFSYVSAMASCGLYFHAQACDMQKEGRQRTMFTELVREIELLSKEMGISFDVDLAEKNLKILDELAPSASTSMQRDIDAGKHSEIDGLLFEVVRLGRKYHVSLPGYEMVAQTFRELRS